MIQRDGKDGRFPLALYFLVLLFRTRSISSYKIVEKKNEGYLPPFNEPIKSQTEQTLANGTELSWRLAFKKIHNYKASNPL